MRRQKKFYAWGYADEDLTPEEIKPWEAEIAERYGLNGFDVGKDPYTAEEITLRSPRVAVPDGLKDIVRTDHLTRLEHSYGKAGFDTMRMFMRQVPNPPDAVAFPENEQDVVRLLDLGMLQLALEWEHARVAGGHEDDRPAIRSPHRVKFFARIAEAA